MSHSFFLRGNVRTRSNINSNKCLRKLVKEYIFIMPKRTKVEKLKYYKEKVRKLNEINNRRSIRRRIIQSESSDENSGK